ncbi:MAG: LysM domain-containing protein [Clostridia bacterium]|nr:LysM domain-containing protein [Clostridia bacterium]MDD4797935.1 LysM domain-containing protein [Clostridia bacterium]
MEELFINLERTVFLPKGSPGVFAVNEISAKICDFQLEERAQNLYCQGELEITVDYLAVTAKEMQPQGMLFVSEPRREENNPWQAQIALPFEFEQEARLLCASACQLTVKECHWFVVAPRAIELTVDLVLSNPLQTADDDADEELPVGFILGGKKGRDLSLILKKELSAEINTSSYHEKMLKAETAAEQVSATPNDWQIITKEDTPMETGIKQKEQTVQVLREAAKVPPVTELIAKEEPKPCPIVKEEPLPEPPPRIEKQVKLQAEIKARLSAQFSAGIRLAGKAVNNSWQLSLYRVREDETPAEIALKKGISLNALQKRNGLCDGEKPAAGCYLFLP